MATGKLAQRLLNELAEASGDKGARGELIAQRGQILVIDQNRFKEIIKDIFPRIGKTTLEKIWTDWNTYLLSQDKNITSKARKAQLVEVKKEMILAPGEHAYIIASYETIKKAKSGKGKLGKIIQAYYKGATEDGLGKIGGVGDTFGAQLGHEETGRGLAASAVKTLKAESALRRLGASDNPTFQKIIVETKNRLGVEISHEQVLTKNGQLRKKYIPILTWQKAVDNQTAKLAEEQAIAFLEQEFKDLATMKGSTPLATGVGQVLLGNVAPKSAKIEGIKKQSIREKNKSKKQKRIKQKTKQKIIRDSGVASNTFSSEKSAPSARSYVSLQGILNSKLSETVEKNMRFPGLENRTGRFASSVRVTDISTTGQGFPSIGYTYRKDPYQVFEVGAGKSPWATPDRDPRKVIDKSIREIAAQMAIGRFYTRRV